MLLLGKSVINNGALEVHWKTEAEGKPEFGGIVTCRLVGAHVEVGYQVRVMQLRSPVYVQRLPRDAEVADMVGGVYNLTWRIGEYEDEMFFAPLHITRNQAVCNNIGVSLRSRLGMFARPFLYQATIDRLQAD